MGEVEPQPVRRHQRAALRDMIAQRAAQRLVQQVGRGMVGADGGAAGRVHGESRRRALHDLAFGHLGLMHEQIARALAHVGDARGASGGADDPAIADLTA